jgi:hypothetical protein
MVFCEDRFPPDRMRLLAGRPMMAGIGHFDKILKIRLVDVAEPNIQQNGRVDFIFC